jgi:hypothetical protein
MANPVFPITTSSAPSTIATLSSRWDHKTVTIILGLTALGVFLYTVFSRYASASATPTKENPLSLSSNLHKEGSPVPFTNKLTYQGNPCINEPIKPQFEKYAPGIIRFDRNSFGPNTVFNIECKDHTGKVFSKKCASTCEGSLDCFIDNLPFGREITVEFGTPEMQLKALKSLKLKIEQTGGLYTIIANDDELNYESIALGDPKVQTPSLIDRPLPLAESFLTVLTADKSVISNLRNSTTDSSHFILCNLSERSVIYLLLISQNPDLLDQERAVALPVFLNTTGLARFSLSLLEDLWANQYSQATGKDRPSGDLQLHLGGLHQIVYTPSTSKPPKKIELKSL